ncbi:F-box domain-containing protein [Mycena sanguinolenta]|uniref:F-box domain-containing protein n=1 Tax=Mycena sanguinolenta TaxID=230812 RepID=A0A8H7DFS9_9AGAR|nr:F-box domain-containing protein [Mycena sanguinolenta]
MNHDQQPTMSTSTGTVCPALTLPVEITSEIFLCCASPTSVTSEIWNPFNNLPVLLTQICREWRLIALSTPKLWSDIHLQFGGRYGRRTGHIDLWWVSFLEAWFSRAQDQPLTMVISNLNHPDPDEGLVTLLDSYRRQWRDLTIKLPFDQFYRFAPNEELPMLERLALDTNRIPRVVQIPITTFQDAPKLNHVFLGRHFRPSHFTLPWLQLTSIELTAALAEDCLECLRQAPRLVTCSFDIQAGGQFLTPVSPLPRLISLTLSGATPTAIFPFTTMPGIEELNLVGRSLSRDELIHLNFFMSRCSCRLRRLRLHFISEILTTPAIELLEALPSLESLELAATEASTIATLFSSLCRQSFLPQLQYLSLSHHRISDGNMRVMFEGMALLLVRRCVATPEHVQLQSFFLEIESEQTAPPPWVRQRLQELVAQGMVLDIGNRRERWT